MKAKSGDVAYTVHYCALSVLTSQNLAHVDASFPQEEERHSPPHCISDITKGARSGIKCVRQLALVSSQAWPCQMSQRVPGKSQKKEFPGIQVLAASKGLCQCNPFLTGLRTATPSLRPPSSRLNFRQAALIWQAMNHVQ